MRNSGEFPTLVSMARQRAERRKPRQSTIKGITSRRLNQLVWAEINGKPRKVRFYRLVEQVLYEMKAGVKLICPATRGQKAPPDNSAQSPGSA